MSSSIVLVFYRALVRLLASVPPHVHDEHVLGFERFLVARALLPAADEALLVGVDVVVVDVLDQVVLRREILVALLPVAVSFDEIARLVLHGIARAVVVHGFGDCGATATAAQTTSYTSSSSAATALFRRVSGDVSVRVRMRMRMRMRMVAADRLLLHLGAVHLDHLFRIDGARHGIRRFLLHHLVLSWATQQQKLYLIFDSMILN